MTDRIPIMVVFGTRPEAIKVAPLVLALEQSPRFRPIVVVTGQHREMLDQVLELFGIVPHDDLAILRPGQGLGSLTSRILEGLDEVLATHRPAAVVVQGDTTTAFTAALAAFYQNIPVVHVEAGLRTNDLRAPFPEEANRRLVSVLAALHLAPTGRARENLVREGVARDRIVVTGNTVIDALQLVIGNSAAALPAELADLEGDPRRMVLVTTHRRESWGEPMAEIGRAIAHLAADPDLVFVLPLHRNPLVRDVLVPILSPCPNVRLVEPLHYGEFARLLQRCDLILTDSGGIQEEGPGLGKPVLVLRDTSERPEAIAAGTSRLVGTSHARITREVRRLLDDPHAYAEMATAVNPFGDGLASERSLAALEHLLGIGPAAEELGSPSHGTPVIEHRRQRLTAERVRV